LKTQKNFLHHIGSSPDLFKLQEPASIRFFLFILRAMKSMSRERRIFEPHQQVHFSLLAVYLFEALAIECRPAFQFHDFASKNFLRRWSNRYF
jgi:hypothetical protein